MPSPVALVHREQSVTLPDSYTFEPDADFEFSSVRAKVSGAGAAASFIVVLEVLSQDGKIITQSRIDQEFAVGDTGALTWAPFLRRQAAAAADGRAWAVASNPTPTAIANNVLTAIVWQDVEVAAGQSQLIAKEASPSATNAIQIAEDGLYAVTMITEFTAAGANIRHVLLSSTGNFAVPGGLGTYGGTGGNESPYSGPTTQTKVVTTWVLPVDRAVPVFTLDFRMRHVTGAARTLDATISGMMVFYLGPFL